MAELTVEELQKQLAKAKAMFKKSEAEKADILADNEKLKQVATDANAVLPIKGSYKTKWKNPLGKLEQREVAFVDGHKNLFLAGKRLPTEAVLKCANGAELSAEEVKSLQGLTEEGAQKHLTHLAKIGYAYLK